MALSPQTVDAPLLTQNQQVPKTAQVVGRIQKVVNGVIKKFEGAASQSGAPGSASVRCKVEPRDGFFPLSSDVFDINTGASLPPFSAAPTLLHPTGDDGLLGIFDSHPAMLSPGTLFADNWHEAQEVFIPPSTLSTQVRYTSNATSFLPDEASIQNCVFTAWVDTVTAPPSAGSGTGVAMYTVQTLGGSTILAPTQIQTNASYVKVIADPLGFFWVFVGTISSAVVSVYFYQFGDGQLLSSPFTFNLASATDKWDVKYSSRGVLLARPSGGAGVTTTVFTFTGGSAPYTIVATSVTDNTILCGNALVAWLNNPVALGFDTFDYLTTVDGDVVYAWQIQASGAQNVKYNVAASLAVHLLNIAGYMFLNGSSLEAVVAFSVQSATDDMLSSTRTYHAFPPGGPTSVNTNVTATTVILSRAFLLGSQWYVVSYYPGASNGTYFPTQSCYFLQLLSTDPAALVVTGRFEYLLAFAGWNSNLYSGPNSRFQLTSPTLITGSIGQDGSTRVALSYMNELVETTFLGISKAVLVSTVGIKEYIFSASDAFTSSSSSSSYEGQADTFGGEVFIPGPQAELNSGPTFSEDNVNISPEAPVTVAPTTTVGAGMTAGVQYFYQVVFEGTNNNGDRWFSRPSPQFKATPLTGGQNSYTLTGYTCDVSQRGKINISIYRTSVVLGIATTLLFKVTSDINPLLNDPTTTFWTFVDTLSDTIAQQCELLYTSSGTAPGGALISGELENYPAPAFSQGTSWQQREWLIGYDGAIWFSGLKTEGRVLWFNPGFRVFLPTNDRPVRIEQLDSFMVIFTRSSIWTISSGNLPDDTGSNGTIPVPTKLPFPNGCSGFTAVTREGVHYTSSATLAPWLITRDLRNVYIGAGSEDDFNASVVGIAINQEQRVCYILEATGVICVWDSEVGAWTTWQVNAALLTGPMTSYQGQLTLGYPPLSPGDSVVVQQIQGVTSDNVLGEPKGIPLTLRIAQCDLGGVRNFKRCWATQFFGYYLGDHDLFVDMFIDDNTTTPVASYFFTPTADVPYLFELAMKVELCSNVGLEFRTSFPRDPSGGASFESLAFYLGLEKGLNKLPISRRIPPQGG